jgi:hypothetical protein
VQVVATPNREAPGSGFTKGLPDYESKLVLVENILLQVLILLCVHP